MLKELTKELQFNWPGKEVLCVDVVLYAQWLMWYYIYRGLELVKALTDAFLLFMWLECGK